MPEPVSQSEMPAGRVRPKADQRYPKYDLLTCVALAKAVKDKGGNDCSPDQLGAYLGYTNTTGGGFAAKVANSKAFGLIESEGGRYRITARAEAILYPTDEAERQRALADSFMAVPIYRRTYDAHKGQRLPEALGMKNYLHREFGIPAGEAATLALRVMMDSADQAGLFTATQGQRTKLVLPAYGAAAITAEHRDARTGSGGGGGNRGDGAGDRQAGSSGAVERRAQATATRGTLLDGVWEMLPDADNWDEGLMKDWIDLLEKVLRVRYRLPAARGKGADRSTA